MASLFSIMPSGAGPIPLERLEAAASEEDVLVDCLIDEELYWLRGGGPPDPGWDEPYLSSLDDAARAAALDSGLRSLIAKGMVDVDPDEPSSIEVLGVYGLLAGSRRDAPAVTRAVLAVPDEPTARYAFHRLTDVLVLFEEVSDDGFHDFTFQSLDSAAMALSSIFDRRRTAGEESGPHLRATQTAELRPTPSDLTARATHVVSLVANGVGVDGRDQDSTATVYGTVDGVWAHWIEHRSSSTTIAARMGAPDLFVLASDILSGRTPSG